MSLEIQEALLPINTHSRPGKKINPTAIAVHYVGNAGSSAQGNRNYFASGKVYASSHYIIGLNGEILHLIPENEISYCTNQANSYTISIECCHPDSTGKFNQKTYDSLVKLCADICKRRGFNPLTKIIRHYDVTKKCCPKWWSPNGPNKNADNDFNSFKQDVKKNLSTTQPVSTGPKKVTTTKVTTYDEAVNVIVKAKLISSPDFWYLAQKTIKYIDTLFINIANNLYDTKFLSIIHINDALDRLKNKGVMNTTEFWKNASETNKYLGTLLITVAQYIK